MSFKVGPSNLSSVGLELNSAGGEGLWSWVLLTGEWFDCGSSVSGWTSSNTSSVMGEEVAAASGTVRVIIISTETVLLLALSASVNVPANWAEPFEGEISEGWGWDRRQLWHNW